MFNWSFRTNDFKTISNFKKVTTNYFICVIRNFFINNYKSGKIGNYAVYYKPDKKVIGNVGINNVSPNAKKAELGICVNPQYWGHDFSTQLAALSVISGFEFTTLDKLVVITYSDNKYTPKCINALKFEYIKTFKPKGNKGAYTRNIVI